MALFRSGVRRAGGTQARYKLFSILGHITPYCCLSTKKIIRFASRTIPRHRNISIVRHPDAARAPGSVARRPQTRVQRQLEKLSHTSQPLRHRPAVHTPPSSRAQTSNPTRCRTSRTLERTLKQILGFRRYQGHAIIPNGNRHDRRRAPHTRTSRVVCLRPALHRICC